VDLMGFSVTGDGGDVDYGIEVIGSTNAVIDRVMIKGGTINGFGAGLYCKYMNNSRIKDLVISGNIDDGIYLFGGSSGQCNGNTVANCTIGNNTGRGIDLVGTQGQCDGNTFHGNSIKGNVYRGIAIYYADGNRVEANTIVRLGVQRGISERKACEVMGFNRSRYSWSLMSIRENAWPYMSTERSIRRALNELWRK